MDPLGCLFEFVAARLALVVLEAFAKIALLIGLLVILHAIGGVIIARLVF